MFNGSQKFGQTSFRFIRADSLHGISPHQTSRLVYSAGATESNQSPGKLPNTITLDDMPYRTFTRNRLLVSFLSRLRSQRTGQVFLESRGEGVRKILEAGEAHSGRRPVYELFCDELRLTLWAKRVPLVK